jgi:hypothetical protein
MADVRTSLLNVTKARDKRGMMSGINGDKARFNRERKKKIARRARNRATLRISTNQPKPVHRVAAQKEGSA